MYALFYLQDGSVLVEHTSIITDEYRPESGWIEVILPQKLRRAREVQVAAKVLFMSGKFVLTAHVLYTDKHTHRHILFFYEPIFHKTMSIHN